MVCWARVESSFPETQQSQELEPCRASTACCHANVKAHPPKFKPKDEDAAQDGWEGQRTRAAHWLIRETSQSLAPAQGSGTAAAWERRGGGARAQGKGQRRGGGARARARDMDAGFLLETRVLALCVENLRNRRACSQLEIGSGMKGCFFS